MSVEIIDQGDAVFAVCLSRIEDLPCTPKKTVIFILLYIMPALPYFKRLLSIFILHIIRHLNLVD